MARIHIHISVDNIEKSIGFYSALFGLKPSKIKTDYAKWLLDDPKVNFAISSRGAKVGIDHLGIQAESSNEMESIRKRINDAGLESFNDGETVCCYAKSDKSWVRDPNEITWETYHTMEEAEYFTDVTSTNNENSCCAPKIETKQNSCKPKSGCC